MYFNIISYWKGRFIAFSVSISMLIKMKTIKLIVILSCFSIPLFSQDDSLAQLVFLQHYCGDETGGSVEFELLGNSTHYTYYWAHGPQTLSLENLMAGVYTFIVEDFYGCTEVHDIEILYLDDCYLTYQVIDYRVECQKMINLQVFSSTGVLLDPASLSIDWLDGSTDGLQRVVTTDQAGNYCVDITVSGQSGECCALTECVSIAQEEKCEKREDIKIIVNEFNRNSNGGEQYLELLVRGNGECESTTDIRGFIVDDNNGELIPASEFVGVANLSQIGISPGFITFSNDTLWSAIPNGSLIVLYGQRGGRTEIPMDDPMDSNGDGVYVLSIQEPGFFYAKQGNWDNEEKVHTYTGYTVPVHWDLIAIDPFADGMQVRHPTGDYCHGISLGAPPLGAENLFDLWLGSGNTQNCNCRFVDTDFLDKGHFEYTVSLPEYRSPGLPNSGANQQYISHLLVCPNDSLQFSTSVSSELVEQAMQVEGRQGLSKLTAYPNPFKDRFWIRYNSRITGEGQLFVSGISGQVLHQSTIKLEEGEGQIDFVSSSPLPPGILIISVLFPDGHITRLCMAHIQ